jgi:hypothetical protein
MTKLFSFLTLSLAIASFAFTSTPAHAQPGTSGYIVNATSGLNVRDQNCNKITTVGFKTYVNESFVAGKPSTITCKINGVNTTFLSLAYKSMSSDTGYLAKDYLSPVIGALSNAGTAKVTSTSGLNLRDQNCKKLGAMPYNATVTIPASDAMVNCQVGGQYYLLQAVVYNGKSYYAASQFLK